VLCVAVDDGRSRAGSLDRHLTAQAQRNERAGLATAALRQKRLACTGWFDSRDLQRDALAVATMTQARRASRTAMTFFATYVTVQLLVSAYGWWHADWFAWRMFSMAGRRLEVRVRYVDGREETLESFEARTGKGRILRQEAGRARFVAPYLCASADGAASIEVREEGQKESYPCRR
jgi:hypothetical protein